MNRAWGTYVALSVQEATAGLTLTSGPWRLVFESCGSLPKPDATPTAAMVRRSQQLSNRFADLLPQPTSPLSPGLLLPHLQAFFSPSLNRSISSPHLHHPASKTPKSRPSRLSNQSATSSPAVVALTASKEAKRTTLSSELSALSSSTSSRRLRRTKQSLRSRPGTRKTSFSSSSWS